MHRRPFLVLAVFASGGAAAMRVTELRQFAEDHGPSPVMPPIFIGHGGPMNAIRETPSRGRRPALVNGWTGRR